MNPLNHVDRVAQELAEEMGAEGLDMLIEKHIDPDPDGFGIAEARTSDRGVSVWAIVGQIQWSEGDLCVAASAYGLSQESVQGALAFYWRNRMMIRARIALNNNDPSFVEIEA